MVNMESGRADSFEECDYETEVVSGEAGGKDRRRPDLVRVRF